VDRLAERGLIARKPDPADRRGLLLSLTETGRELQQQIGREHARGVAHAMRAALTPDELAQLEALCLKLTDLELKD
jgi:DNA-binding MarR family transcriptional regulator